MSCFSNVSLWLYQNRTLPWIFFGECSYFFQDIYLFKPPNNHCFDKVLQGQLSLCNQRNIVIALRTLVKSHKSLNPIPYPLTLFPTLSLLLTLFRMDLFFRDAHGWWGAKRPPSLTSVTHILQ